MAGKLCVAIDYHGTLGDLLEVSKLGSRRRLTQLAVVLRFVVRVQLLCMVFELIAGLEGARGPHEVSVGDIVVCG